MPIDTRRVWLTQQTYERARIELAQLLVERATGSHGEHAEPDRRELRIRQLQELIGSAAVGYEPPDDSVAEPGMVLTVHYETDDLTETFLMADREESTDDALPICSPQSPLGAALCGARAGDRRTFQLPGGDPMTVRLMSAVPYRSRHRLHAG
ncbi:GreA/GreB family elongation factor [Pseudonocardia sp. GCM10023141]|uniref:GreA/GreB family elongation factor n=1 Tax=Pseudonocardia sp. GCM10023141 TaxID=3252653 RepID=UPI0036190A2F